MSETQHPDLQDLDLPPPAERAAHYRELAEMNLRLAQQATIAEARVSHLELAGLWTRLAATAEHQAADCPAPGEEPGRATPNP